MVLSHVEIALSEVPLRVPESFTGSIQYVLLESFILFVSQGIFPFTRDFSKSSAIDNAASEHHLLSWLISLQVSLGINRCVLANFQMDPMTSMLPLEEYMFSGIGVFLII